MVENPKYSLPAVTADEMRRCDERAINEFGINGILLMENAGASVARVISSTYSINSSSTVFIFCGKGNNGGDGFVVGRHLLNSGAKVVIILSSQIEEIKGDALTNFNIISKLQTIRPQQISICRFGTVEFQSLPRPSIIVDALYGTGFKGEVKGVEAEIIKWINKSRIPTVSVDIPSGVISSTGVIENLAVEAERTVTFAYPKIGLFLSKGKECSGRIHVIDINIPSFVKNPDEFGCYVVGGRYVKETLPKRKFNVHKYSIGKVFVIAGARGYTGAATLTAQAVLKSGAGAVVLGCPDAVYPILAKKLTEEITLPLPSTKEGSLSLDGLEKIEERIQWADVVAIGPGIARNPETLELVRKSLLKCFNKVVIDADALFALDVSNFSALKNKNTEWILTPHLGEFSRLFKIPSIEVESDKVGIAKQQASQNSSIVVLKGAPTITAIPEGKAFINSTGNPGMATVGSGDVLTGIISGLWSQGMNADDAAICGVFLHGLSGDLAKTKLGERSLTASSLLRFLPAAFQSIENK